MKTEKILCVMVIAFVFSGCQTLSGLNPFKKKAEPTEGVAQPADQADKLDEKREEAKPEQPKEESSQDKLSVVKPAPASSSDTDLKIAKVWSRLDELEREVLRQRERIFLLEKGLLTGIPPEELLQEIKPKKRDKKNDEHSEIEPFRGHEEPETSKKESSSHEKHASALTIDAEMELNYERDIKKAENMFNGSKKQEAAMLYKKIGATYPIQLTKNNHLYWEALSWYDLKNYDESYRLFKAYLEVAEKNDNVPLAKFYFAMSDGYLGRKESRVQRLTDLIKEYPDDKVANMARNQIKELSDAL